MAETNDIGMIGLAVMGRNLVLNIADHGFSVAAFNRTEAVTQTFATELQPGQRVQPCYSLQDLVGSLKRPRRLMLMVKAGPAVDAVIEQVSPLLEAGDVLIDGGNSFYLDTDRRQKDLAAKLIRLLGVGISGGEYGARTGPSMMPGGSKDAYESVRNIFEAIAAEADGRPCVEYLGPGAAGHYVKMVHNGIEYGVMQIIADSYSLLKVVLGLSNDELADVYEEWNAGELNSYLAEITAHIFKRRDEQSGLPLIDLIVAEAEQLGTGMWASESSMDLHVPAPNLDIAVAMRSLSALSDRGRSADPVEATRRGADSRREAALDLQTVRDATYVAVIVTYAQGFALLQAASGALGYGFKLDDVASVWRGGCIIRSALLADIKAAYREKPDLSNLLNAPGLSKAAATRRGRLAAAVAAGAVKEVPVPGLMTALSYLDSYRAGWLPLNLIQAQRDYFGAHTYKRVDREGVFHTDWLAPEKAIDGTSTRA